MLGNCYGLPEPFLREKQRMWTTMHNPERRKQRREGEATNSYLGLERKIHNRVRERGKGKRRRRKANDGEREREREGSRKRRLTGKRRGGTSTFLITATPSSPRA